MKSGIYIHMPFCIQRCHYCDFFSSTAIELRKKFIEACLKEIEIREEYLGEHTADTIYFGGGTPSVFEPQDIEKIINAIDKHLKLSNNTEISFEANPDDLNINYLRDIKNTGIDRLSIGIQSFRDDDLKRMNRRHTAKQATDCLKNAEIVGFDNISVDLIYGLPDFNESDWVKNIEYLRNYNINHLSAYHLSIEKGTVFSKWKDAGIINEAAEEHSVEQFIILRERSEEQDFDHYEISNFAKKGKYSRHNTKYWKGAWYLGLGPSAHSYNSSHRQWNKADIKEYFNGAEKGKFPIREEKISDIDRRNELIMTRLRTKWGITKSDWVKNQSYQEWDDLIKDADRFIESNDMMFEDDCLKILPGSWFRADGIISSLFKID